MPLLELGGNLHTIEAAVYLHSVMLNPRGAPTDHTTFVKAVWNEATKGVLQKEEQVSAKSAETLELAKGSPERFGYSWDHYAALLPQHEEQFLRWTTLDKSFWNGVRFLDGGCGIGRAGWLCYTKV